MNFLDLYKKISQIDEGATNSLEECGMEGCGMDHTGSTKQQDNVSMNVTMNGSGSNGIKDLINILRNIEQAETSPSDDKLFGQPSDAGHEEPIIGDSFKNSVEGGSDTTTLDISAVTPTGNDLSSKGKEAPKQAGGGNPWNISESGIAARLMQHYAEVKSRNNVTEGYWGWDPPDDPDPYYGHGEGTIELDLPAPYDINLNSEDYDLAKGDVSVFNVSYDANGDTFDITSVVYYTGDYPDVQIDLNKVDPKWFNYVSEKMDDILEKRASSGGDDYDGGYDGGYDDSGWQDAQNRWEKGIDSRY